MPITILAGQVLTSLQNGNNNGASDTATVQADGYVVSGLLNADTEAMFLQGTGAWTVKIDGGLANLLETALAFENNEVAAGQHKITVGAEGSVAGLIGGIYTPNAADIVNSGQIAGTRFAIDFNGDGGGNLNTVGKKILVDNKAGADILSDQENVLAVTGYTAAVAINNNSFAELTVKNAGYIAGGADRFLDQDDDGNDDDDYTGAAIWTEGALTLTNAATGVIEGNVNPGWIGNKIDNAGLIYGTVSGWLQDPDDDNVFDINRDGDDTDVGVDLTLAELHASKLIGTTLTNKGTIYGLENYGWNDNGTAGLGVDDKFFQVAVDLGRANDLVTNSGKMFGDVWVGEGNDKVTNTGTIQGFISGWEGNDTIINKGFVAYGIGGDNGADFIDNSGTVDSEVQLGGGNDTLKNSGTIGNQDMLDNDELAVFGDTGNDSFTNTGTVLGWIALGDDDDTVIGGKGTEYVADGNGKDTFKLGDGNDWLWVVNDGTGSETFDGGKGNDILDLSDLDIKCIINLAAASGQVSINSIFDNAVGFETVWGSDFDDLLFGSVGKESISGNEGADEIAGRGGKDDLWGDDGADTFIYELVTDSGVTRGTRDTIWDFESGVDSIHFDFFTATDLIANGAFTGDAGELRYIFRGSQTVLEGDVNGDGKADFSIGLEGIINLTLADVGISP